MLLVIHAFCHQSSRYLSNADGVKAANIIFKQIATH